METWDVAVLGGGYAGVLAAQRAAGLREGARVLLVNAAPHFVERIRLHEVAVRGQASARIPLAELLEGTGASLCVGRVEALDAQMRRVHLRTDRGEVRVLRAEHVVYALGSRAEVADVPGAREHAHTLADEAAALRLHAALSALAPGAEVLVVGAGATGLELAAEVAEGMPHLRVTLVSRGACGEDLSPRAARALARSLRALGVTVLAERSVVRVGPEGAVLADGTRLAAALTVWTGGFTANPLARASGLATTEGGQLLVDDCLRSVSHPWVFGAGDGATPPARPGGQRLRMACATAIPMGAHAGGNVARALGGEPLLPFRMSYVARCLSLGRRRGLLQVVHADDSPRGAHLDGWLASRVKEGICRFTVRSLRKEGARAGSVRWPGEPASLPARATSGVDNVRVRGEA